MQRVCATCVPMHNAWLHACARRQSTRAHTSVLASVSTHIPRLSASACSTCSLAEREVGAAAAVAVLPPPPPGAAAFGGGKEAAGTVSDARQPVSRSLPAIASFTSKSTSRSAYAALYACESGSPRSASSIAMCSAALCRAFCRTNSHGSSPGKSCNRTPAREAQLQRLMGLLSPVTNASVPAIRQTVVRALPTRRNTICLSSCVLKEMFANRARRVLYTLLTPVLCWIPRALVRRFHPAVTLAVVAPAGVRMTQDSGQGRTGIRRRDLRQGRTRDKA